MSVVSALNRKGKKEKLENDVKHIAAGSSSPNSVVFEPDSTATIHMSLCTSSRMEATLAEIRLVSF